jgi:hypothetical protein
MPALFPPSATRVARGILVTLLVVLVGLPIVAMIWVRTPYARGEGVHIVQPIPFDHRIHVTGLHIDCRFCHVEAERSASAGLPSTQQCVPCHSQAWMQTKQFAPVRASLASGKSIPWNRVTQLPDFVYFNHAIHVHKGVGCETCHGRVDKMATVHQTAPLTMSWCVNCHRDPAPALRPVAQITTMGWTQSDDSTGLALMRQYRVRRLTNCTTCHR